MPKGIRQFLSLQFRRAYNRLVEMRFKRWDKGECFECGYSFRGHAGEFRCPECGICYDERTTVYPVSTVTAAPVLKGRLGLVVALLGLIGFVLGPAAFGLVYGLTFSHPDLQFWNFRSVKILFFLATNVVVGVLGWQIVWSYIRKPYIAFTTDGIVVNLSGRAGDFTVAPWQRLRDSDALHERHGIMYWLQEELRVGVEQRLWPEVEAAARRRIEAA